MAVSTEERDIALPRHFGKGLQDSFQCWFCPAVSDDGAPAWVAYLRKHYPALYRQLVPLVERVNRAVQEGAEQCGERVHSVPA